MANLAQGDLFSPVRNQGVFSSHWLEHRLELEPEWAERADDATAALDALGKLWAKEGKRVEKYGNEQNLEYAFIQPVMEALGWKLHYQTFLQGREPDYALFVDDAALGSLALVNERSTESFQLRRGP